MNGSRFNQFFHAATDNAPYLYQCRLACGEPPIRANCDLPNPDEPTRQWLSEPHPKGCHSQLINIPTGLGKTAAVVLATIREFAFASANDNLPAAWTQSVVEDVRYRTAWLKAPDEPFAPGTLSGIQLEGATRMLRPLTFCRRRGQHVIDGPGRMFCIEFAATRNAIPFSIGSQSHFGLGLFVPADSELQKQA